MVLTSREGVLRFQFSDPAGQLVGVGAVRVGGLVVATAPAAGRAGRGGDPAAEGGG